MGAIYAIRKDNVFVPFLTEAADPALQSLPSGFKVDSMTASLDTVALADWDSARITLYGKTHIPPFELYSGEDYAFGEDAGF